MVPPSAPDRPTTRSVPEARVLGEDELRTAHSLFGLALHMAPVDDERWARSSGVYAPGRTLGIDGDGGVLAGTAMSFPVDLTVPGGAEVPTAAVTRVGVRADHTRRGLLTALMTAQLTDIAARGEVAASLRASEARIYGRFGYGLATRGRDLQVTAGAALRPTAPGAGGRLRMIDLDEATTLLPALYARIRAARPVPGLITRTPGWWDMALHRIPAGTARGAAVHLPSAGGDEAGADASEPDGYLTWTISNSGGGFGTNTLEIGDLQAATPAVEADLWRFALGMDLLREVTIRLRPLDDPLELLVQDYRAVSTTAVHDETWLRLVDVPRALAVRAWGDAEPVRVRVRDALLPANDGVHLVGAAGSDPREPDDPSAPAELECDVAGLAMAYLGDRRPSELVAGGWWTAHDQAAVARADTLFAVPGAAPWCGTFF